MSAQFDDGGPAFPETGLSGLPNGEFIYGRTGMTLRDWFAGQALATLIADERKCLSITIQEVANSAYEYADAMISARKEGAK